MTDFHPDLARARFLPTIPTNRASLRLLNTPMRAPAAPDDIRIDEVVVNEHVRLRIYRPKTLKGTAPALFWMHGGGYILGSPLQDEARSIAIARGLGITVVSTTYRLAPAHPAPAATEDAYAGLNWVFANAELRAIDPARIAIGGASAGAGLAAGLALYTRDRGGPQPAFQLLVYPMLDDRTVLRTDLDTRNARGWKPSNNRFAWRAYLGQEPGSDGVSPYAAPARRDDLSGLPPAWIGVGTLDIFHDEDLAYAERLRAAGVPVEVLVVPGAFHGFDAMFRSAGVTKQFQAAQDDALRRGLAIA